jgi:hypothetical protein
MQSLRYLEQRGAMNIRKWTIYAMVAWILAFVLYIKSNQAFCLAGESTFGTLTNREAQNSDIRSQQAVIAKEVDRQINTRFSKGMHSPGFNNSPPVVFKVMYQGEGVYDVRYRATGRGVVNLVEYLIQQHLAAVYTKVSVEEGTAHARRPYRMSGGLNAPHIGRFGEIFAVTTFIVSVVLLFVTRSVLKELEDKRSRPPGL